jgi:hypothetical protein
VANAVESLQVSKIKWSVGAGPRYLLLPKVDVFMRFQAAFTQEGPGFYLFLGEAF